MKILIADDEPYNRLLMSKILSPLGMADQVVNGREAVEAFELALIEGVPYEIVCLDIMMPEMDGQEALQTMREMEGRYHVAGMDMAKIFMVTALETENQVVTAFFKGGCTDYLVKPVNREMVFTKFKENGIGIV